MKHSVVAVFSRIDDDDDDDEEFESVSQVTGPVSMHLKTRCVKFILCRNVDYLAYFSRIHFCQTMNRQSIGDLHEMFCCKAVTICPNKWNTT